MSRALACLNLLKEARKYDAALNVEVDMEYRIAIGMTLIDVLLARVDLLLDYLTERQKRKLKRITPLAYHRH